MDADVTVTPEGAQDDEIINAPEGVEGTDEGAGQEGQPPKPAKEVDGRTSAFRELRAHNKQLEQALREQGELLRNLHSRIPQPEEPSVDKLVKPTLAQFQGDLDAYEAALEAYADAKHSLKAQTAAREAWQKQQQASVEEQGIEVEFGQKLNLGAQALPDLAGALERIKAEKVGEGIHDEVVKGIKRSPAAAELFHYLEANRQETAKIEKLHPRDQVSALRAIEQWILRGNYRPMPKVVEPTVSDSLPGTELEANPVRKPPRPSGGSSVTHTPSLAAAKNTTEYLAAFRQALKKK